MPKTAALRAAVFALSAKNRKGGVSKHPPGPARVNIHRGTDPIGQFTVAILVHNLKLHSYIAYSKANRKALPQPGGPIQWNFSCPFCAHAITFVGMRGVSVLEVFSWATDNTVM